MIRSFGKESIIIGAQKISANLVCDSDDVKPVIGYATGTTMLEVDTGDVYMFSEDDKTWYKIKNIKGESSGGGGDSDFVPIKFVFYKYNTSTSEYEPETDIKG